MLAKPTVGPALVGRARDIAHVLNTRNIMGDGAPPARGRITRLSVAVAVGFEVAIAVGFEVAVAVAVGI